MRIATWNINSVKIRIDQVLSFLQYYDIDVLMLQEIKCTTNGFPYEKFDKKYLYCAVYGQRTYNGVAIISKYPISDINFGNTIFKNDDSARYIDGFINERRIVCVYVPNGREVGSPNYFYKLDFLDTLIKRLKNIMASENVIVGGDFNITRSDNDVWDPKLWRGRICCSDAEREKFQALLDLGFRDAPRTFSGNKKLYTWWDYRDNSFMKNHGLRLDYILTELNIKVLGWRRYINMRSYSRPSDHAPVLIEV